MIGIDKLYTFNIYSNHPLIHMNDKYFKIVKKTTTDYIEGRISASEFKEKFNKLDKNTIYKNLERNGYKGVSNFVSAVSELDDQSTLESQWIVSIIDYFYAYFTNNFSYIYSSIFYKYLKSGLEEETENPVEISFNKATQDYIDNKISNDCLGFIAKEFLNDLKYFKKEITLNQKLYSALVIGSKLSFNRILEDLTSDEKELKNKINEELKKYLIS